MAMGVPGGSRGGASEAKRSTFSAGSAIDWGQPQAKVSRHFTVAEVTNWGASKKPGNVAQLASQAALLAKLDEIRDLFGGPIGVFKWGPELPCADIYPVGGDALKLEELLNKYWEGALWYGAAIQGYSRVALGDRARYGLGKSESVRQQYIDALPEAGEIDWGDPSARVSEFFTVREVTQGDRRRIPDVLALERVIVAAARELDKVRTAFGGPIGVTSWYRPAAINRAVGGVSFSTHIDGHGIDIYPMAWGTYDTKLEEMLKKRWGGGIGLGAANRGFTHIDGRGGGFDWGPQAFVWWY